MRRASLRCATALGGVLLAAAARPTWAGAGAPAVDLLANRWRWHLFDRGLVIAFAGEGFRKYTHEYRSVWGAVTSADGRRGRALAGRHASLRFPWSEGEAARGTVTVRLHSGARSARLSAQLNHKAIHGATLSPGWQTLQVAVPAGALVAGENQLDLAISGGPVLFHSLEIIPGDAPAPGVETTWPAPSPVIDSVAGGARKTALAGHRRLVIYTEIPAAARLRLETGVGKGSARLRIAVRPDRGKSQILLDATQAAGAWIARDVPLAPLAGKLVALDLEVVDGDPRAVAWAAPRIVSAAVASRKRPGPARNVILWVGDALRADRLAVYGKTPVRTPRITAATRAGGVVFLHNQAASPSSPPSHASIQTGMIPRVHGVTGDKAKLAPGIPMLSSVLTKAGVSAGYYGNNAFGMARLEKPGRWTAFHQPTKEGLGNDCDALVSLMLAFADGEAKAGHRFFLSALAFEPHTPYRYHEAITDHYFAGPWDPAIGRNVDGRILTAIVTGRLKMTEARWRQLKALYDGEVEHMDGCFGALLDGLARLGLAKDTAIVLTGDHGEGFFEHGGMGHAFGHWAEVANVPLILLVPGLIEGTATVETVTGHIDIVPTILDILGLPRHEQLQGESLLPLALLEGPAPPRVMSLEYGTSYALRARGYRYIVGYDGAEKLYDEAADPTERTEIEGARPLPLRYFRDLAGFFLAHRSEWRISTWGTLGNQAPGFVQAVGS